VNLNPHFTTEEAAFISVFAERRISDIEDEQKECQFCSEDLMCGMHNDLIFMAKVAKNGVDKILER